MIKLKPSQTKIIADLFQDWNETMIQTYLQGYMGEAWADRVANPQSAQIVVGDFCFYGGFPDRELVEHIPSDFVSDDFLMIAQSLQWEKMIEQVYGEKAEKIPRYAIKKDTVFNKEKLQAYIDSLSSDYEIHKIDRVLFSLILEENWSKDLCSNFISYEQYENWGIGYVVLYQGKIVCGASSYTIYDKGIEIEIDTKEKFRRKGLALACASKLILSCLEKGLYPSWDAANLHSVALSEKLGYVFEKEYNCYAVSTRK